MATHALVLRMATLVDTLTEIADKITPQQIEQANAVVNGPLGKLLKGFIK
jgi:hypothetical protein